MIDYNKASFTYDNTRNANEAILQEFGLKINLKSVSILDLGCGTGSYLKMIFDSYGNKAFGVEPSDGMREKAIQKNPCLDIRKGNHKHIPFDNDSFDFIYMTDVIHHIPNLNSLFSELQRVLKFNGFICIATQSWEQIEARWYNRYFDSLVKSEKSRYPDISFIIDKAKQFGLVIDEIKEILNNPKHVVTQSFIQNVEEKNFSMFRKISEEELNKGIQGLKNDLGKEIVVKKSGETLIWIRNK